MQQLHPRFIRIPQTCPAPKKCKSSNSEGLFNFILNAPRMTSRKLIDKNYEVELLFQDLNTVLAISDRPKRIAKTLSNKEFVALWQDESSDGFAKDPPNAVIDFRNKMNPKIRSVVSVVINNARLGKDGNSIILTVDTKPFDNVDNNIQNRLMKDMTCGSIYVDQNTPKIGLKAITNILNKGSAV
jgi:hypothetical protein